VDKMEEEERKIPYIRVLKKDIKNYDEQGLTIEYKGKEWTVQYGDYVSKEDIDNLDDEDVVYIKKYGKRGWLVANAVKVKREEQEEEKDTETGEEEREIDTLRKELEECREKLRRIEEILKG